MSNDAAHALARLTSGDQAGAITAISAARDATDLAALGMVCLGAELWGAAYGALRRALALEPDHADVQLNLALAEDRLGLDGRARMRALMAARPAWDEPPLRLAETLRRAGDPIGAIGYYERVLTLNPNRAEALLGLGILLLGQGEFQRAQVLLLNCCGLITDSPDVWDALGIAFMATRDAVLAEAAFAESYRLRPGVATVALRRTDAAIAAGTAEAELARLEIATLRDPLDVAQLTVRGVLLDRLGRPADAVDILEATVALAPDVPMAAAALANAQLHSGRFDRAVPALQRAVELSPDDISLQNDLAAALNRVHRYREGRAILERLVAEHGERLPFLCNLVNALVALGHQREGAAAARRAAELEPAANLGWRTLASALAYCPGTTAPDMLDVNRQTSATLPRGERVALPRPSEPERRLRIGLLSATLKTHPVGWLTIAAFESLDPLQFEIVCFAQAPGDDPMQRRFRAVASDWHTVWGQSAPRIAATIRAERIDVLIDLGGWGEQGMVGVCALRAAPVQMKWVGMQNHSTGLPEVDYMISDRWETPDGSERYYSERLLRMPDGYVCYSPPTYAPEVARLPAAERGWISFGCFNNLCKIAPETLAVWSSVLLRVPESRLILKTHQFSDLETVAELQAVFASHGVAPTRIEFRGGSSHRAQLAQHNDVDIILDPFPYAGGLTTCEALWMGVPVVTLSGALFSARHSTSHLCNVGLHDWVAEDIAGYIDIAARKAADIASLGALRSGLRDRLRASPLCDQVRFGRHFAAALRGAWRDACAS